MLNKILRSLHIITRGVIFTAFGNVKITYPSKGITATSHQAQYLKEEGIVVLSGDVDLRKKGEGSLQGQRAVYFLDEDRLVVDSPKGSQVLLDLFLGTEELNEGSSSL